MNFNAATEKAQRLIKKVKQNSLLILIFVGAPSLWASTILWAPKLSELILERSNGCEPPQYTKQCQDIISIYGATGDIFGVITSLFSGLALFAVAATLWVDTKSRKEDRKPLVIAHLDSDSIILHSPVIDNGREINMKISLAAINETGETALNVSAAGELIFDRNKIAIPKKYLSLPLNGGREGSIEINHRIFGPNLLPFLSALTEDGRHIELDIEIQYQSLENIDWITSATYELRCMQPGQNRRLNAVRANTDDFEELWGNHAAVSLDVATKDGSWKHRQQK